MTVLFLHGFPSSSYDWRHQFDYFSSRGYGIIAPDLLGYGGTDKPADAKVYTLKTQASEIIDLLDCADVGTVLSVGHDLSVHPKIEIQRIADHLRYTVAPPFSHAWLPTTRTGPPSTRS